MAITAPACMTTPEPMLDPAVAITDAAGVLIGLVRQKWETLPEALTIYGDQECRNPLYRLVPSQTRSRFATPQSFELCRSDGQHLGTLTQEKAGSLISAYAYEVHLENNMRFNVFFDSVWKRAADRALWFWSGGAAYIRPALLVTRDGREVLRLIRRTTFNSLSYGFRQTGEASDHEIEVLTAALTLIVLLERAS